MNNDRLLRALTGLNRQAFDELLPAFTAAWQAQVQAQGQRAPAGGQADKARLSSMSEKLFYILFCCKCYPTFDVAGIRFAFDRSQANRWMHRLQPILEAALGQKMVLPERIDVDRNGAMELRFDGGLTSMEVTRKEFPLKILIPQQVY